MPENLVRQPYPFSHHVAVGVGALVVVRLSFLQAHGAVPKVDPGRRELEGIAEGASEPAEDLLVGVPLDHVRRAT